MDLLVLFPLEFLANFPASKDMDATRVTKLKGASALVEELEDAKEVHAKLRFEFTKIPALLSLKPN